MIETVVANRGDPLLAETETLLHTSLILLEIEQLHVIWRTVRRVRIA
jgi:hypothetical protein